MDKNEQIGKLGRDCSEWRGKYRWVDLADGKFRPCLFSLKCQNCKKGFIKHQSQWSCTSRNSHGASEMRPRIELQRQSPLHDSGHHTAHREEEMEKRGAEKEISREEKGGRRER